MAPHETGGLLADTNFWVLLATAAFAVLAYVKGRGPLLALLDSRTARIKADLDEAERLREEAQALLSEAQRQHREAEQAAEKMIATAQETALRIEKESAQKRAEMETRREAQLIERIARAEASAVAEMKRQAADIATRAAQDILRDALAQNGASLVDKAIEDIPAKALKG